jgi:hypothetical protein
MPASSIDTFFACAIMITLVLVAMVNTSNMLRPSMDNALHQNDTELLRQLAEHLLLSAGAPSNWGNLKDIVPTSLGLADSTASIPYGLDMDKVSRLNNINSYSLSYAQLWQALGVSDVSFSIEVKTLFNISITLLSSTAKADETTYQFDIYAHKSGTPVPANLRCYVIAQDYIESVTAETSTDGHASISEAIPNSMSGTAILATFAKAQSNNQIVAFNAYTFAHNSSEPLPNRTFTQLSPLNHILNLTFSYSHEEAHKALVLTFNYNFSLTEKSLNEQSVEYEIPRLLDVCPMVLVVTGFNGSSSFAEWTLYPQLPLTFGANFEDNAETSTVSFSHIVTINSVFYEIVTHWRLAPHA